MLLALQRLVNVLGAESPAVYQLILPVMQYSVDLAHPEAIQLVGGPSARL